MRSIIYFGINIYCHYMYIPFCLYSSFMSLTVHLEQKCVTFMLLGSFSWIICASMTSFNVTFSLLGNSNFTFCYCNLRILKYRAITWKKVTVQCIKTPLPLSQTSAAFSSTVTNREICEGSKPGVKFSSFLLWKIQNKYFIKQWTRERNWKALLHVFRQHTTLETEQTRFSSPEIHGAPPIARIKSPKSRNLDSNPTPSPWRRERSGYKRQKRGTMTKKCLAWTRKTEKWLVWTVLWFRGRTWTVLSSEAYSSKGTYSFDVVLIKILPKF